MSIHIYVFIYILFKFSSQIVSVDIYKKQYGTKTEYNYSFWASGNIHKVCADENYDLCIQKFINTFDISSTESYLSSCQVKHVSGVLRHGSRYPSKKSVIKIEEVWQKIKAFMPINVNKSYEFKTFLLDSHDSSLAENGKIEHYTIGKRIAQMFKNFLSSAISSKDIEFLASSKIRTVESGQSFQFGLDEVLSSSIYSKTDIVIRDDLLRFYDFCKRFSATILRGDVVRKEINNFHKNSLFDGLISKIHKSLNLSERISLDAGNQL